MGRKIPVVVQGTPAFEAALGRLLERGAAGGADVETSVRQIIADVRKRGDVALRELTQRFEGRALEGIEIPRAKIDAAERAVAKDVAAALRLAADRIRAYHEEQLRRETGFSVEKDGVRVGVVVVPLERAGIYAPGGKARYPSSVLMAAIPAVVAGVRDVLLASPAPPAETLFAAKLAGVSRVFDLGGAQAIAALAYGTPTVPRVDLVAGPGNRWVTAAKRLVFGDVGIDGLAGPSEAVILADDHADPALVAADLLTQAEHDEASSAVLVATSEKLARAVVEAVSHQLATLPRKAIAARALGERGAAFVVKSVDAGLALASKIAPEHLTLFVKNADAALRRAGPAGAVFLGADTPQAAGDYLAGPSHVLPTGGAARWGSPLGVWTFLRRSSVIEYSARALAAHAGAITAIARAEGLEGHAKAVEIRKR